MKERLVFTAFLLGVVLGISGVILFLTKDYGASWFVMAGVGVAMVAVAGRLLLESESKND